jgi:hypothetical protein
MKSSQRFIGLLLSVLLSGLPAVYAQTQAPTPPSEKTTKPSELPDSPGYTQAQQNTLAQTTPPPQADQSQPAPPPADQSQPASQPAASQPTQSTQSAPSQPSASQPTHSAQPADQNPAGAATAQRGKTAGGAASRPAGAGLAPAKQRNPRSLLIKLGLLAGAGVAVGTAFALSQASPSRPPGAH